jgi:hypothetical protein
MQVDSKRCDSALYEYEYEQANLDCSDTDLFVLTPSESGPKRGDISYKAERSLLEI